MDWLSGYSWLLIGALVAMGVMAFLHALARAYEDARKLHDLKMRVGHLRKSYTQRLAEMSGVPVVAELADDQSIPEVDVFPIAAAKDKPEPAPLKAAA